MGGGLVDGVAGATAILEELFGGHCWRARKREKRRGGGKKDKGERERKETAVKQGVLDIARLVSAEQP